MAHDLSANFVGFMAATWPRGVPIVKVSSGIGNIISCTKKRARSVKASVSALLNHFAQYEYCFLFWSVTFLFCFANAIANHLS